MLQFFPAALFPSVLHFLFAGRFFCCSFSILYYFRVTIFSGCFFHISFSQLIFFPCLANYLNILLNKSRGILKTNWQMLQSDNLFPVIKRNTRTIIYHKLQVKVKTPLPNVKIQNFLRHCSWSI